MPWLLRRFDGNLRGVTLVILALGETRGFILGALTLAAWIGLIPSGLAILAIGAVMSLGGAATTIGGTNLLAWYGAIMPDHERRFVAPRVMGLTLGLGAILLLPVALLVQLLLPTLGVRIYAVVFLVSGIAGVIEIAGPAPADEAGPGPDRAGPGRRVARRPIPPSPHLAPFLRSITIAAFGAGFGPYLSIYSISVLGLPPSFAILLSAISSAASLVVGHGRRRAAGPGQRLADAAGLVPDARLVDAPGPDRVPGQSAGRPGHLRRGRRWPRPARRPARSPRTSG